MYMTYREHLYTYLENKRYFNEQNMFLIREISAVFFKYKLIH